MEQENLRSDFKQRATPLAVVQAGERDAFTFKYESPNAGWWYTLGVLDWMCVDVPITLIQNAGLACYGLVAFVATVATMEPSSSSSSSGDGGGSAPYEIERYNREQNILNNAAMGRPF